MPDRVGGRWRVPSDKSITHRALLLAAAIPGRWSLEAPLRAADTESTAATLRRLGSALPSLADRMEWVSPGWAAWRSPHDVLDCGNSGTTARLVLGLLAGRPGIEATLTGDASLRRRPMRRVAEPLRGAGADIEELGEPDRLPLRVRGTALRPIAYVSSVASAQVKSALLLAGLASHARVEVYEPTPTRDHTERLLRAAGARLTCEPDARGGVRVAFEPGGALQPLAGHVPGDLSSAMFLIVRALLADEGEVVLEDVGINPTRTAALQLLRRLGADIEVRNPRDGLGHEPMADLVVRPSALRPLVIEPSDVPGLIDELPALVALGVRVPGEHVLRGAAELRVKESDRLAALATNLRRLGVEVEEYSDGLRWQGTRRALRGRVEAFGDHRIAMAFGVLAAVPGNDLCIDEPDVVAISFPSFWEALHGLGGPAVGVRGRA